MLNKKTLFNVVYAIAFFSMITSCFGILNELLNLVDLYDKRVYSLVTRYDGEEFSTIFTYFLISFCLCALTTIVLLVCMKSIAKGNLIWVPNLFIAITCIAILILSLTLFFQLGSVDNNTVSISSFEYTLIYAFRSIVLSYIASAMTLFVCNIIHWRSIKKLSESHEEE